MVTDILICSPVGYYFPVQVPRRSNISIRFGVQGTLIDIRSLGSTFGYSSGYHRHRGTMFKYGIHGIRIQAAPHYRQLSYFSCCRQLRDYNGHAYHLRHRVENAFLHPMRGPAPTMSGMPPHSGRCSISAVSLFGIRAEIL